jgi:hypothetical protein
VGSACLVPGLPVPLGVGVDVGAGVGVGVEVGCCVDVGLGAKDAREDASSWASGALEPFAVKSISEVVVPEERLSCNDSRLVGGMEEGGGVGVGWTWLVWGETSGREVAGVGMGVGV